MDKWDPVIHVFFETYALWFQNDFAPGSLRPRPVRVLWALPHRFYSSGPFCLTVFQSAPYSSGVCLCTVYLLLATEIPFVLSDWVRLRWGMTAAVRM